MRRPLPILSAAVVALGMAVAPSFAQTPPPASPSPAAPPETIDPSPIRPENPAPPATAPDGPQATAGDDPLHVAPNVSVARLSGTWEAGGRKGVSRVVGVIDGGRQRFYVQWLAEPDGSVIETKELEDPEAAKLTFGDVRAEAEDTGVSMFLDTVPDKDGIRDTWVLIVGEPGEIRFGPATN